MAFILQNKDQLPRTRILNMYPGIRAMAPVGVRDPWAHRALDTTVSL